jgi:hypothetical protein
MLLSTTRTKPTGVGSREPACSGEEAEMLRITKISGGFIKKGTESKVWWHTTYNPSI